MSYRPAESVSDPAAERELQRVANSLNNNFVGRFRLLHRAPTRPTEGQAVICDGVDWNPLGDGLKRPIWFDADANSWKSFS